MLFLQPENENIHPLDLNRIIVQASWMPSFLARKSQPLLFLNRSNFFYCLFQ